VVAGSLSDVWPDTDSTSASKEAHTTAAAEKGRCVVIASDGGEEFTGLLTNRKLFRNREVAKSIMLYV
jgi:hypothetical protein